MRWDVARELDQTHGLPRLSLFDTLYRTPTWRDIERGRGDRQAWRQAAHRSLEERAGRPLPPLHEEWRASQRAISPNLALVRELRPPYKLGILSNADLSLRDRLEGELALHHAFDDVVSSAEVGMAKPEAGIFMLGARRRGLSPEECVLGAGRGSEREGGREV